jgi:SnoaL-like domain
MDEHILQRLADRAAITDVVTGFAVALDTRNWELLRSCLADTIEVDYPDSVGVATFAADDLVATAQRFFGQLDATLHISANHQIALDGDRATCVSTLLAAHYLANAGDQAVQRQVGYYTNHLERLDGWRIRRTEQHQSWTEGNPAVFAHAAAAFA